MLGSARLDTVPHALSRTIDETPQGGRSTSRGQEHIAVWENAAGLLGQPLGLAW
jgi:hypothetical protein